MFGLFASEPYRDGRLGTLERARGYWQGECVLPPLGAVRLKLAGGRKAPDAAALALARELPARFPELVGPIQTALFEHYEPCREALETVPRIPGPEAVWPHVTPVHVLIEPLGGVLTIEIALAVAWDEEHTVGARIQDWRLVELCGSV